jgi:hypothetical protein
MIEALASGRWQKERRANSLPASEDEVAFWGKLGLPNGEGMSA